MGVFGLSSIKLVGQVGGCHTRKPRGGLSGAVLAHLGEFRLEPREIRRLGCLSAWGGGRFPTMRASVGPPTDEPTNGL